MRKRENKMVKLLFLWFRVSHKTLKQKKKRFGMMTRQQDISRKFTPQKKKFHLLSRRSKNNNIKYHQTPLLLISCYILHATDHRKSFFFCCV